jgi:hypothetical protein
VKPTSQINLSKIHTPKLLAKVSLTLDQSRDSEHNIADHEKLCRNPKFKARVSNKWTFITSILTQLKRIRFRSRLKIKISKRKKNMLISSPTLNQKSQRKNSSRITTQPEIL